MASESVESDACSVCVRLATSGENMIIRRPDLWKSRCRPVRPRVSISREQIDTLLDEYYDKRGWNQKGNRNGDPDSLKLDLQ